MEIIMNFLEPNLNPTVSCDKSAMEGYEAKNLISKNYLQRASGFLAYTTINPPVELDFELICHVDIHYIVINSTVGNHKSTGIEVLAKCSSSFVSIGKSLYDEDGVVFLSSKLYTKGKLPPSLPQNYHICFLRKFGNVAHNAQKIKIKILRSGKFVPCIGSIEVWGSVSRLCSKDVKQNVEKLLENFMNPDPGSLLSSLFLHQTEKINDNTTCPNINEIPDDFKDDLTYELMTIPMTLPSGKTVDQSTLEKHIASEKQFGRKPGDPFTGLKFTNNSKPILNVSLKCRIDMFKLKNSSKFQFSKSVHIVGRKKNFENDSGGSDLKRLKLDDGDEIMIDVSKLKLKQFKEAEIKCCYECKSPVMLFILPCKHIFCRKCLNGFCVTLKCKCCSKCFQRSNIERFHI